MNRKHIELIVCVAILVFALFSTLVSPTKAIGPGPGPIYVPDDFEKIQWAVDNASEGDTIIVRDGLYIENVDVHMNNLTIRSENGSANCTVQAANQSDYVFEVTKDYVNISGFKVTGSTGFKKAGFILAPPITATFLITTPRITTTASTCLPRAIIDSKTIPPPQITARPSTSIIRVTIH